jgi:hypothetical protein
MADNLTFADFEPLVGETFEMTPPGAEAAIPVVLTAADRTGEGGGGDLRAEPFSLVFEAAGFEHLPQQTVSVNHAKLGQHDLFVVPHGPTANGMRYGAVFN